MIYAIVYVTRDDPHTPRLDHAWDGEMGEINPEGVSQALADTIMDLTTRRACLVPIEVPDEALLQRLDSATALQGTVPEADPQPLGRRDG